MNGRATSSFQSCLEIWKVCMCMFMYVYMCVCRCSHMGSTREICMGRQHRVSRVAWRSGRYVYACVCMHTYTCIYTYTHTKRRFYSEPAPTTIAQGRGGYGHLMHTYTYIHTHTHTKRRDLQRAHANHGSTGGLMDTTPCQTTAPLTTEEAVI